MYYHQRGVMGEGFEIRPSEREQEISLHSLQEGRGKSSLHCSVMIFARPSYAERVGLVANSQRAVMKWMCMRLLER